MKKKWLIGLMALCISVFSTIALVACGGESHTCSFNKQVINETYKKKQATCKESAVYYYSCECGAKGEDTFSFGEYGDHEFTNYVFNDDATCLSDGTNVAICEYGCGETDVVVAEGSSLKSGRHSIKNGKCEYCFKGESQGLVYS